MAKKHLVLWYRPGKGRPTEFHFSKVLLRVLFGLCVFIATALILESVFYMSLLKRAVHRDQLLEENRQLRTEVARVELVEAQLRELQIFGYQVKRSLTEGADLGRILEASEVLHGEGQKIQRGDDIWYPADRRPSRSELLNLVDSGTLWRRGEMPSSWPVESFVTRGFELSPVDPDHSHNGLDFALPRGTPVRATAGGMIIAADWTPRYGHRVIIDHGGGVVSVYGHNEMILVHPRDRVDVGTPIALSGNSGLSTAPHLHFEIWIDGRPVDPFVLLPQRGEEYDDG